MDWFDQLGHMTQFFPDSPALGVDMALNGADPDLVGYGLAYGLQSTPAQFDVYPPEAVNG